MGSARGTAWRCPPILHNHNKLVAGLLFPVQCEAGADLTYGIREEEKAVLFNYLKANPNRSVLLLPIK